MYKESKIGASLLMGGSGHRFGDKLPKQFCLLKGKPLYLYALETLLEMEIFEEIVIVCHPDWMAKLDLKNFPPIVQTVPGGSTRQESSFLGLCAFRKMPEWVVIHDAARPFVTKAIVLANLEAAMTCGSDDTCVPSTDTLVFAPDGHQIVSIPKRHEFFRGQTPQTFRYSLIAEAHARARQKGIDNASDDCQLIADLNSPIAISKGHEENMKITSSLDLKIAEIILEKRRT